MEIAQAQLDLAIRHLKQVEERVAAQRQKIVALRARGKSTDTEEEQLGSLLRAIGVLKTHLANVIDPAESASGRHASCAGPVPVDETARQADPHTADS